MRWRIQYIVNENSTIPSPVWRFETEPHPDLQVFSVSALSFAFSGQSFSVSWTVVNKGNLSVIAPGYADSVFIGHSVNFSSSHLVKTVQQSGFVDAGKMYNTEVEVSLQDDDVGSYYVFVQTDSSNRVRIH